MQLPPSCSILSRGSIEVLTIENSMAKAAIALFGGQLLSFIPKHDERERFWLSKAATFDGKSAIRGGVPVCWPWFGDHAGTGGDPSDTSLPSHGYARTQQWQIESSTDSDSGTQVRLRPSSSEGAGFPARAGLTMIFDIGQHCSMQLLTTNQDSESFTYNCALHSYFAVENVAQCRLTGLSGAYLDKTQHGRSFETPSPYAFIEETDRVHLCQPPLVVLNDGGTSMEVHSRGHDSIVVWNPWQDKSVAMRDMEDDSYLTMLCVETAITQGQTVLPGETHILRQIVA